MKHKNLKIICATVVAIFNLFVCFTGVWAWFVATHLNNASDFSVGIYTHELDMSYRVYKYSDDDKAIINATGYNDALTFQEYDSVLTERNINTAILIEFEISGMALHDNLPIYINSHCTNSSKTAKVISNIIFLQFDVIPSISSADPTTIYNQAVNHFESVEKNYFNQATKVTDIEYELDNYSSAVVNGGIRLYILLDYSSTLINNFEFTVGDAATTTFSNDLTRIDCYTYES